MTTVHSNNPPVPKLPGYVVSLPQSLGDKRLSKGQTLTYINGYQRENALREVKDMPAAATAALDATAGTGTFSPTRTTTFEDSPGKLPQWVENDRKVLRFYGYFKESVVESNIENHRVRKVILYYYLEDGSMHAAEPKQDNSGIPQGMFIKRHVFLKDDGASSFGPPDFSVGSTVTIYGRTYFLVDADGFTRQWYKDNMDATLAPELPYPDDPVDAYRANFGLIKGGKGANMTNQRLDDFKGYIEARLGKPSHLLEGDKLRQFLENNKKVLRFWCIWDDRQSMYGDRRPYVLHYFLEDDTVEILELNENNSGRDPFPVFLRRTLLPKNTVRVGTTTTNKHKKTECYSPADFRLGTYVNVYNRDFLLHDADRFTKAWLMDNLGLTEEELLPVDMREPQSVLPRPALPPFNGYGTLQDSLQNCLSLVPKPPRRDMHRLMNKDKIILRFTVRMVDTDTHKHSGTDLQRRFVLSYFMMDDTMQVFEPPIRNSGIAGGKFLERQPVYKRNSEEVYTYTSLYVGATLEIFNRTFELTEADEYTYTYMENNKHIFIMADHEILLKSLRAQAAGKEEAIRTAFIEFDKDGSGVLSGEQFEEALHAAGLKFTRHQAISLKRRLDKNKTETVPLHEFLAALGIEAAQ